MWLECCCLQVILVFARCALVNNQDVDTDQSKGHDANVFSDVIKNITRVNTVLQELIKNYEQLQKMYKASSIENDYSSDSEIDDVYKQKARENNKRHPRTYNDTTYPPTKKSFYGTEMIMSEEHSEAVTEQSNLESDEESDEVTEQSNYLEENKRMPEILRLQVPDSNNSEEKDEKHSYSAKESNRDHKHSDELKVPGIVFYDNVHFDKTAKKETREGRSLTTDANTIDNRNEIQTTMKAKNTDKKVQKILHTEYFSRENIWGEIANKKPIDLKTHRSMIHKPILRAQNDPNTRNGPSTKQKKTALVIVTKHNVKDFEKDASESISEASHEINKELFKSSILRQANGDACLKLVVKKCYKAMRLSKNSACRTLKCKSSFKEKFLDFARTGCIREFENKNMTTATSNSFNGDNGQKDATRVGLEECYPMIKTLALRNGTTPTPVNSEIAMLRDRFEKACQRASTEKCKQAGTFAYNGACLTEVCSNKNKSRFNKYFGIECKRAYGRRNRYRSSSSASSSSSWSSSSSSSDSSDSSDSSGSSDSRYSSKSDSD